MYHILPYTYQRAAYHNVTVKPSTVKNKKIDVFKNGVKLASVGGLGYNDYPTYIKTRGIAYANSRRALYRIRHKNDLHVTRSPGWWANKLLW